MARMSRWIVPISPWRPAASSAHRPERRRQDHCPPRILGLTAYEGQLKVLGHEPFRERTALMHDACFIADVAVLPGWLRVDHAIDFVAGVHPRFRRDRALALLAKADITGERRMRELSKGMKTQVHLALTMAIDAKLLVLDEPTLGLDILARRAFYDALVNDYMDETRTI